MPITAYSGQNGLYFWLYTTNTTISLGHVLEWCPALVVDQFVVISSFDSGPLHLSEEERASGWYQHGELACSPRIRDAAALPWAEFDEWYIFKEPRVPVISEIFVNYSMFGLQDPQHLSPAAFSQLQARFWGHLNRIAPVSYVGYGCGLTIVTCDEPLFDTLRLNLFPAP